MAGLIVTALVLDLLDVVLALALIWIYCVHNAWWQSRVGWALVSMSACLAVVLLIGPFSFFLHWPRWVSIIPYVLITVALIVKVVVFGRERRRLRSAGVLR